MFHTAVIFIKPDSSHAFKTVETLLEKLQNTNITPKIATSEENVKFFKNKIPEAGHVLFEDIQNEGSIAFSIGGDGTFLFTSQHLTTNNIPVVGIHEGNRGFLTPFMPEDIGNIVKSIKDNKLNIKHLPIWQAKIEARPKPVLFINEFILQRHSHSKMVKYTLDIEDMGTMQGRADGLILATGTGSTAYNLTAGGSIIHPEIQGVSLTPICPHNLKHKPIIIPPKVIKITLNNDNAGLGFDGFSADTLDEGLMIEISPSKYKLNLVTQNESSYLDHLNSKMF